MKRFVAIVLIVVLILTLCGCTSWMDGTYYSVTPHYEDYTATDLESVEVSGYTQLREVLEEMVTSGRESGVVYVSGQHADRLDTFMNMAVDHITTTNPVGVYAVEAIDYEVGNNAGRIAVAVDITYNRSRSDILRIKHAQDMDAAKAEIMAALEDCDPGVVILVDAYTKTDFVQLVQDYVDMRPDVCMEMPQVAVDVYPQSGTERIVELSFSYQTSRDTLRMMQNYVQPVFGAAALNVSGEEAETEKFNRMYAFLMERNDYRVETSLTPSYSLLRHGVGDSKSFAVIYSAMCRNAGLDCQIVSGTRDGSPWVWNIICEDGVYYYVDLLRSAGYGTMLRMVDENMPGYVWDYSAYPKTGTGYQVSEETTEPTVETAQPES